MKHLSQRRRGFTLVEMIIVLVITGIVGAMVSVFIRIPVQSYVDSGARADMTDVADTALRRLVRDVRLALPNSVRVSNDGRYLEMLLTKSGGRYLSEDDDLGLNGVLNFTAATPSPNPLQFTIVGNPPAGRQAIVPGDAIVVYNLGPGFEPANAYQCTGVAPNRICNRANVAAIAGNLVTLSDNPFVNQVPPLPSPTRRFQVVSGAVSYYCDSTSAGVAKTGTLSRYAGYTITAAQPADVTAAPLSGATSVALLAKHVASCNFSFLNLANTQRGLVSLTLQLQTAGPNTEGVTLSQQVHVNNAP